METVVCMVEYNVVDLSDLGQQPPSTEPKLLQKPDTSDVFIQDNGKHRGEPRLPRSLNSGGQQETADSLTTAAFAHEQARLSGTAERLATRAVGIETDIAEDSYGILGD